MSDGTSVGKISLQVDLQGDMQKQISEMANNLGSSLKSSLEKATNGMLSGMEKVIDSAMKNINASISDGLEKMKEQTKEFVSSLQSILKKIKVPAQTSVPMSMVPAMNPVIPSMSSRGPPASGINSAAIQGEIDKVSKHLELVNQKIEIQQDKLAGLKESYERALNPNIKNKLASQINNTELSILKLTEASDKMGFKLNDLDSKMNGTTQATGRMSAALNAASNKIKESASKATQNMTPLGKASDVIGTKFTKMGTMITSALKRVLIMATLYKVIRGFMRYMSSALATNQQFSNSMAQIKSNLQVAFIPIYNAILPALNTFISAISRATAYMASFLSVIFGSTFKASSASAKALNKQKAAIAGVGAASKKAAKDMQLSLAGFDEITNLSTPGADAASGGGGGGASSTAPIVSPGLDLSKFEAGLKNLLDKLDPYFEPIRQAFGRLKEAFEPLKENLFAGLKWLFDKVLVPLGKWTITEVVPRFLDMLANVFKILNNAIEALKPWWSWLWENFYVPLSTWTGGVIITVLDGINAALSKLGDWIGENKTLIENLVIVVASFAAAWALVNGAIAIWTGLQAAYAAVTTISTVVTSAFATAVAFLTSPITLVILAIGALIAIGILLWKNWDKISAWLKKIWEGIKETAGKVWSGIVSTIKNVFNGIKEWFSGVFTGAWNGIKKAFSSVGSFFQGIWTTIKNTFTTIGSVIGNGIADAFKTVVNSVITFAERTINGFIRAINGAIKLINLIPGVSINPLAPLAIPKLATGGVIDQPTIAMVGEAGKEAVVPLERNTEWIDKLASKISAASAGSNQGASGDVVINLDGREIARVSKYHINRERRMKGIPVLE